jgi:hypothetical protein
MSNTDTDLELECLLDNPAFRLCTSFSVVDSTLVKYHVQDRSFFLLSLSLSLLSILDRFVVSFRLDYRGWTILYRVIVVVVDRSIISIDNRLSLVSSLDDDVLATSSLSVSSTASPPSRFALSTPIFAMTFRLID